MIPTADIVNYANAAINNSNALQSAQLIGVYDAIESGGVAAVANTSVLPSASLNKGRLLYVSDIGVYRYSDGTSWINNFDTTYVSNQLFGFGCNNFGRLGTFNTTNYSVPTQEYTCGDTWYDISSAPWHTAAIKGNNTLWSWGANGVGQLGNGSDINFLSHTQEYTKSTNWCKVSTGTNYTLALKSDNTLWGWGCNSLGQLGTNNGNVNSKFPGQEYSVSKWSAFTAGTITASGIKTDGSLWSWGGNASGEIGDNTTVAKSIPTREASTSTNWCRVSASNSAFHAIKTDGSLWSWGSNICGQLGDNTTVSKSSPVIEITSSTSWCQVCGWEQSVLAIKTDGSLWSWGINLCGQLADGTIINRSSPVREITSSTNWCQASAGRALKKDGTLWSWGINDSGQLGNGTTVGACSPVQESTLSTNWTCVNGIPSPVALKSVTTRGFFGQP